MRRLVVFLSTEPAKQSGGEKGLVLACAEGGLSYCMTTARVAFEKQAEEMGANAVYDVKVQVAGNEDRWTVTFTGTAYMR
jgi:hypothetical protein